jgi:Zn-dependent protease with chaperone function
MHLSIYVALVSAAGLSLVLRPLASRLAPMPAAISLAAGSIAAGVVWVAGLGVLAVATLGRLQPVGELGRWSVRALDARDPVPPAAGITSLIALIFVVASLAGAARRMIRCWQEVQRLRLATARRRCGDLAIIDDPAPEAMALPGWAGTRGPAAGRGSIVVTSGMLKALGPTEREVMLAHERSHLRNGHWAYRLATRLGALLLPLSAPLIDRCDLALERWADEHAAEHVGDRRLAATAVAKAALATTDHYRSPLVPAFSDGPTVERVEALLMPRRSSRWGLAAFAAGISVVAVATLLHAGHDLDALFDTARYLRSP